MKSLCLGTMEISFYWEDEVEDKACKMETVTKSTENNSRKESI